MKILTMLAALAVGVTSTAALAQALTISQSRRANVFGLVEIGTQVRPVIVTQTGQANMAGVIQAGGNPRVSITQSGRSNTAFVGQFENSPIPVGRVRMP